MKSLLVIGTVIAAFFWFGGAALIPRHMPSASTVIFVLLGFAIWSYIRNTYRARTYKSDIGAAIRKVSGVTDSGCIDTCRTDAIALNYRDRAIFVIRQGSVINKFSYDHDVLSWEYRDFDNGSGEFHANVIEGMASNSYSPNPLYRMSAASATGAAVGLAALGNAINQVPESGCLRMQLNDAHQPFADILITNRQFIDRLQHFWQFCQQKGG